MSAGWKVYLDDVRPTPEGWIHCYWPDEVIQLLKSGNVDELSLDHDLGDAEKAQAENRKEITGKDVLAWLEEYTYFQLQRALNSPFRGLEYPRIPPKLSVHSDNASARQYMQRAIEKIEQLGEQIKELREEAEIYQLNFYRIFEEEGIPQIWMYWNRLILSLGVKHSNTIETLPTETQIREAAKSWRAQLDSKPKKENNNA